MTDVSDDVTNVIRKALPRLANSFQNQKGKILGFGFFGLLEREKIVLIMEGSATLYDPQEELTVCT